MFHSNVTTNVLFCSVDSDHILINNVNLISYYLIVLLLLITLLWSPDSGNTSLELATKITYHLSSLHENSSGHGIIINGINNINHIKAAQTRETLLDPKSPPDEQLNSSSWINNSQAWIWKPAPRSNPYWMNVQSMNVSK